MKIYFSALIVLLSLSSFATTNYGVDYVRGNIGQVLKYDGGYRLNLNLEKKIYRNEVRNIKAYAFIDENNSQEMELYSFLIKAFDRKTDLSIGLKNQLHLLFPKCNGSDCRIVLTPEVIDTITLH